MYNEWKTPEEQHKHCIGFLIKREPSDAPSGETVSRDVECMEMTWEDVCHKAMDREEWKEWTARCASHRMDYGRRSKVYLRRINATSSEAVGQIPRSTDVGLFLVYICSFTLKYYATKVVEIAGAVLIPQEKFLYFNVRATYRNETT